MENHKPTSKQMKIFCGQQRLTMVSQVLTNIPLCKQSVDAARMWSNMDMIKRAQQFQGQQLQCQIVSFINPFARVANVFLFFSDV